MFGVADYWAFVIAVIVFLAIPGVGNLAIITSTSKGRIAGGLAATFGVIVGDQVLMWCAVTGVAAILTANPALFGVIQYAGAVYLGWLGIRMVLAKPGAAPILDMRPGRFFPAGDVHHVAQPEGHRLLHGLLSALRRPCPASGPRHFRGDGAHHRRMRASPRVAAWLNRIAGTMWSASA